MIALILATIMVWDKPVEFWGGDDAVQQRYICRQRDGGTYRGCFAYGEPGQCEAYWWERAAIDFPGENYVCGRVKPGDVEAPLGLK